jgi:crotonobetainyl-CoA:carnitine CoA-transferase CaiB-like acyl-CoA transferase
MWKDTDETNGSHRPLSGVRVIDAAAYLTGPYAALMLADLGAEVVKVEPPRGDPFRRFGRRHNGTSIAFLNTNRGKRSVILDLRQPADQAHFEELVTDADILLTNWRAHTVSQLGLDGLEERHPRLIWIRITGFGPDGPLADAPAFDSVIQARCGLAASQGNGSRPTLVVSWVCDKITATFAAQAALAALVDRARTGRGASVDLPMIDVMSYFNFPDLMIDRTVLDGSEVMARLSTNRPVPTADGWLQLSPVSGRQIAGALDAMDATDQTESLRSISDATEMTNAFFAIAEERTPKETTAEWLARFAARDVPAGPVLDLDAHLADPQVLHNNIYQSGDDPRMGPLRHVRYPGRFSGASPSEFHPAPALDEHHAELAQKV